MIGGGELGRVRVLSAGSVEEMMRLGVRAHPRKPEGFGLGFGVRHSPGRELVWWDHLLSGAAARLALRRSTELELPSFATFPTTRQ